MKRLTQLFVTMTFGYWIGEMFFTKSFSNADGYITLILLGIATVCTVIDNLDIRL